MELMKRMLVEMKLDMKNGDADEVHEDEDEH